MRPVLRKSVGSGRSVYTGSENAVAFGFKRLNIGHTRSEMRLDAILCSQIVDCWIAGSSAPSSRRLSRFRSVPLRAGRASRICLRTCKPSWLRSRRICRARLSDVHRRRDGRDLQSCGCRRKHSIHRERSGRSSAPGRIVRSSFTRSTRLTLSFPAAAVIRFPSLDP